MANGVGRERESKKEKAKLGVGEVSPLDQVGSNHSQDLYAIGCSCFKFSQISSIGGIQVLNFIFYLQV